MSNKCKFVTKNNVQCKRNAFYNSVFCWQHTQRNKVSVYVLIAATISILWGGYNLAKMLLLSEENKIDTCDRNVSTGCTLDLKPLIISENGAYKLLLKDSLIAFKIVSGGKDKLALLAETGKSSRISLPTVHEFPFYKSRLNNPVIDSNCYSQKYNTSWYDAAKEIDTSTWHGKIATKKAYSPGFFKSFESTFDTSFNYPYKIAYAQNELLFEGKISDLETDELIAWFDGNSFETYERCAISWNKDEKGVEIIDKYGNVCFQVEIFKTEPTNIRWLRNAPPDELIALKFNGYYEDNGMYYVYGDTITVTNNIKIAKQEISKIKPIFKHIGNNVLGKRIKKVW